MSSTPPTPSTEEAEVHALITEVADAVCAKDVGRIMAHYADEATVFDAIPPFQLRGAEAFRASWAACLPFFPDAGAFRIERRDLRVHVAGELAVAHWIQRFDTDDPAHPCGQGWLRITSCCRKLDGRWKILHEHVSAPFNPEDGMAVMTPDA